jgi:hypothetical protein
LISNLGISGLILRSVIAMREKNSWINYFR